MPLSFQENQPERRDRVRIIRDCPGDPAVAGIVPPSAVSLWTARGSVRRFSRRSPLLWGDWKKWDPLDSPLGMLTVALVDRLIAEQESVCEKIEALIEGLPEDRAVVNLALAGVQASLAVEKLKEARRLMDETGILFGAV